MRVIVAIVFAVALLDTFAAKQFERVAHRYPRHAGLFHLLGEVEVVFGLWAIALVLALAPGTDVGGGCRGSSSGAEGRRRHADCAAYRWTPAYRSMASAGLHWLNIRS